MKNKIRIVSVLLLSVIISTSCIFMGPTLKGNGNVVEETRKVSDFDEIEVSRGMNVYISQGENTKVVVKADDNLLDAIETNVYGDVLEIKVTKNIRHASSKKVYVTIPDISVIKASSGSNVYSENQLNTDNLELSSSSGSNIKLTIRGGKTEASSSSGSNITLKGETRSFSGKASSGSNIFAKELSSKNCNTKASSGANIWIAVETNFTGRVSSGANVYYYGNPENTEIEKSSGGNVIKNN